MATASATPIEIKLGDGSVIKGATMEEAIQNAVKRVEDNVTAYKTEKQARADAEAEAARLRAELDAAKAPKHTDDGKAFNRDRYYQLLNEDPIQAQNYMDQYRFGVPDPVGEFNAMRQSVSAIQQTSVVQAFLGGHDDFPGTPDSARALTQRTNELVAQGFPFTLDTVNYAYQQVISDGLVKPLAKTKADEETPNPSLTGSSAVSVPSDVANADSMSDADLEKLLRSKGLIR